MSKFITRRDSARSALHAARVHPAAHDEVLDALAAEGIIEPGDGKVTDKVNAASTPAKSRIAQVVASADHDPIKRAALRTALSALRAAGTSLEDVIVDGNVSIAKLNDAMRGQTISKRMTCKAALSAVGLIN
jgi:hypothetical protein